jgi:Beta-ketoacyl synthase, N-terminal domain
MRAPVIRALGLLSGGGRERVAVSGGALTPPRPAAPVLTLPRPEARDERHRRATRECLLALAAVEAMLEDARVGSSAIAGERTALLYATAAAYASSNREFIAGGGSIHFAYTAPAVVPAEVAIEFGVTGPYSIFLGGPPATLRAIWQAAIWLDEGACDRALVLVVETFAECADLYWRARRLTGWPLVEGAGCLWLEPGRGQLLVDSRRAAAGRDGKSRAGSGQMFGCEPLATIERWRRAAVGGPLELTGFWRGERTRLAWLEEPTVDLAVAPGRCGG